MVNKKSYTLKYSLQIIKETLDLSFLMFNRPLIQI